MSCPDQKWLKKAWRHLIYLFFFIDLLLYTFHFSLLYPYLLSFVLALEDVESCLTEILGNKFTLLAVRLALQLVL